MVILIPVEVIVLYSMTITFRQLFGWIFLHEQFIGNKVRTRDALTQHAEISFLFSLDYCLYISVLGISFSCTWRWFSF